MNPNDRGRKNVKKIFQPPPRPGAGGYTQNTLQSPISDFVI